MEIHIGDRVADVTLVSKEGNKVQFMIDGKPYDVDIVMAENGSCSILHDGNSFNAELIRGEGGKSYDVNMFYRSYHVDIVDTQTKYLRMKKGGEERQDDKIVAPMPGKVIKIPVRKGDRLSSGDIVVVLEAMKMQSNYKVTSDCTVRDILVNEGDSVNANQVLIVLDIIKRRLIMTREEIYSRFEELDKRASLGGGVDKIEKQHAQGKMTARERIGMLLDKGTFNELDKLVNHRCTNFGMEKKQIAGDGMVTGYGKIDGRPVFVYAYDFTAHGGSLSETNAAKIVKVQQLALKTGAPVIALNDSGGARIQEGVNSLAGYAPSFIRIPLHQVLSPQISAILGPCAGGACYSPALTDFIFMVKEQSHMFITGPDVVKTVTNEEVGKEELGGAYTHSSKSGVTHFMCDNEEETLMSIRELLSFLPSNNMEDAPLVPCNDDIHRQVEALQTVIPEDPNMPYDIKDIIEPVLDNQYFFEVMPHFAKNVVVGFGRLGGRSVGIVANQPAWLAGVLDIDASDKAARFIRFCDCFNIPLITFEDVPGFLPGTVQEHNGIIRHGAKIVYAYAEATVPKVTLITRKAYGGAYIVMSSKPTGADVNLAYPQAEIAVMGAEGAVNILYRKSAPEEKAEIIKEYEDKFSNPYRAAERGLIDEVIMPRDTRYKLIQALEMCHNKNQSNPPKKHGNMPL